MSHDNVLLKIHRHFSKEETMKFLFNHIEEMRKEIAGLKFVVGELKSEKEELKYFQKRDKQTIAKLEENSNFKSNILKELSALKKTKRHNYENSGKGRSPKKMV